MKKVYVQFSDDGHIILDRFDGNQKFALYVGIEQIDGNWLLETNGDPITIVDMEGAQDEECDASIESIRNIISDPTTPWEACNEEDAEYVLDTLSAWGML